MKTFQVMRLHAFTKLAWKLRNTRQRPVPSASRTWRGLTGTTTMRSCWPEIPRCDVSPATQAPTVGISCSPFFAARLDYQGACVRTSLMRCDAAGCANAVGCTNLRKM